MATIVIRNKQLKSSPDFTDRDVLALTQIGVPGIPRAQREQEAADALATIFPDIPPEWIAGGRVRLHTYELLGTIATLKGELESGPGLADAMALIQTLPVSQDVINQARQAQEVMARDAETEVEPPALPIELIDFDGNPVNLEETFDLKEPGQGFKPRSAEERRAEEVERQRQEAWKREQEDQERENRLRAEAEADGVAAREARVAELRAELARLEGEA